MKVYSGLSDYNPGKKIVATLGTFDGVHLGHKKLLENLVQKSEESGAESLLLTFYPHPRMVLFPENNDLRLLNDQEEKIELLRQCGIDHLVIHPFTREFSRMTSTEFVRDILVNAIGVTDLVIGYDHHFGRNREGSYQSLEELSRLYGFSLSEIQAQELDDINISSTKIRNALQEGDISTADKYLGYNYRIKGVVVEGNKLGRSIGFPTANVQVSFPYKLIPALGAYAVRVLHKGKKYTGMLNIGHRPTVVEDERPTLEVNIFNFDESIYGDDIEIEFIQRIRDEKKFESVEALAQQLELDRLRSRDILS